MRFLVFLVMMCLCCACDTTSAPHVWLDSSSAAMTLQSVPGLSGHIYPNVHATTSDPKVITAFLQDTGQLKVLDGPVFCPVDFGYRLNIDISAPHLFHGVLGFEGCRTLMIGNKNYWTTPVLWALLKQVAGEPLPPATTPQNV